MKTKTFPCLILLSILLILPVFINNVTAQPENNYYVTIKPTTSNSPMYTAVGRNWTFTFKANWAFGSESAKLIENATAIIQVKDSKNKVLTELPVNTTTGVFSFNYSSLNADILTFTPIKLTTQDEKAYTTDLMDSASNLYGLKAESTVVWWDTFHVSIVSYGTNSLGEASVSVNVTYLLLPQEGLTLPAEATYSNQTFLPKIVHDATITINGVTAKETEVPGVYIADSSILFPTAYVHVAVSQDGWTTTHTGFSFAQTENQRIWSYALAFGSALTFAALTLHFFISRRANNSSSKHPNKPFFGGILLAVTSIINLYWAAVSLEGMLHGFDWLLLAALGLFSFVFGTLCSIMILRKKNQALAIFAVIVPLLVNVVIVKSALDTYQLPNPWLIFAFSAVLSALSAILISNSDEAFQKKTLQDMQAPV